MSQHRSVAPTSGAPQRNDVLLNIIEPAPWATTYAQPRVKWYSLADLTDDVLVKVTVRHSHWDALWSFDADTSGDFIIPTVLEDGDYRVKVRAIYRETGEQLVSRYVNFTVDCHQAAQNRITCAAPWRHLFLLGKNRVRPCCYLKEGVAFPTNPNDPEEDLWNNRGMVELRDALRNGDARFCHPHCPELNRPADNVEPSPPAEWEEYERGHLIAQGPRTLKISLGSHCNHKCTFCKMGSDQYNHWKQTDSSFNYIARNINTVERLMFTGGEPLVHMKGAEKKLTEAFRSKDDLLVAFQTNGALIDRYMDLLSSIPRLSLSVSMAGANRDDYYAIHRVDDFNRVCENLTELKRRRGEKPTEIELKMVYTRKNYRGIAQFAEVARSIGANHIYFHHLMILSRTDIDPRDEITPEDDEWQECLDLFEEAKGICEQHDIGIRVTGRDEKKVRRFNTKTLTTVEEDEGDLG